jgi:LytS/YehU family sensor histidine kinase
MLTHPWVNLDIELQEQTLLFKLSNSKPGSYSENMATQGIGLSNVQKRLALLYPVTHSLKIYEDDMSFNVCLTLRLHKSGKLRHPIK